MTEFFRGIEYIFEEYLFFPFDLLRELQNDSWLAANALNFVFLTIGIVAFAFWMKELKKFDENTEDEGSQYI
ncbi:MAG: uracil phosphoribosyltransferase [Psychroflexus sp.]|jgi:hypothetical protein|nr:uracil phosphoribosyltransferase [Psychroflexus sp.]MDR9448335.1 uracil phosphoribosyltransferase [Psychroflexus sp.]